MFIKASCFALIATVSVLAMPGCGGGGGNTTMEVTEDAKELFRQESEKVKQQIAEAEAAEAAQ